MLSFKKESNEVLYNNIGFPKLSKKDINFLIKKAKKNRKKIIRFCVHKSKKDKIHQMFIVHPKNYLIKPHCHKQEESMLVIKGIVDVIIFDNFGNIKDTIKMGDSLSGKIFYYKLPKNTFHTLIIKSNNLFFLEIAHGPFKKENMKIPNWSKSFDLKSILKKKN